MGGWSTGAGHQQQTALLAALGWSADVVETFPRFAASNAFVGPVDGTLYLTYFTPLVTKSVSSVAILSSGAGASSGLTLARLGLYTAAANGDCTLVARTASNTSLLSVTQTMYTESFATTGGYPSAYTLTAGVRYAVGILQVGTTPGRFVSQGVAAATGADDLAPRLVAMKATQTDIDGNVSSVADITAVVVPTMWARFA